MYDQHQLQNEELRYAETPASPDGATSPGPQVHIVASSHPLFRQVLWLSSDAFGSLVLCHGEAPMPLTAAGPESLFGPGPHISSITTGIRFGGPRPRRIPWLRQAQNSCDPRVVSLPVPEEAALGLAQGPEQIETVNKLSLAVSLTIRSREKTLVALRLEPADRIVVCRQDPARDWKTVLQAGGKPASAPHRAEPDVNIWLDL